MARNNTGVLILALGGLAALVFSSRARASIAPDVVIDSGPVDAPIPDSPTLYPELGQSFDQLIDPGVDAAIAPPLDEWGSIIPISFRAGSMRLSQAGIDALAQREGLSLTPYQDSAGYWTVGYGHKMAAGEPHDPITEARALELLQMDVATAENVVNSAVTAAISQDQFDALVSFAYNVGNSAFRSSTMLKLINAGRAGQAVAEFAKWVYAGGRRVAGLVNRRSSEAQQFAQGTSASGTIV